MADPLSVAASIAGVITLADIVFLRLMKYARNFRSAEKEMERLAREINLLGGALHSLSRLARGLGDDPDQLGFAKNIGDFRMHHIQACSDILTEIDKKLKKAEGDTLKKKIVWPFSADRAKDLLDELARHKESINLALSATSMDLLLRHLAHGQDMQSNTSEILAEIKKTREITGRIEENSERRKVLDFFLKYNPQQNYETSIRLRHPRTGLWLLRMPQFQTWLSSRESKLWLSGIPGAGKTVLAGAVIEAALSRTTENIAAAFFFCDYKDETTQNPVNILGAILYQLAIQKEEAYILLERYFRELHPVERLPRSPTTRDLKKLLGEVARLYDQVFFIADGLDECGQLTDQVVEILYDVAGDSESISMALFSRDEINIREKLEDDFVSIQVAAHTEDITEYVTAEIEERIRYRKLRIYDLALKEEILQGLVNGAKGMFRWVACQFDHLGECMSDQECREALVKLPPTLNETYLRILKRIPRSKSRVAQMVLHFVAYASPRLTIRQMRELLSVPEGASGSVLEHGAIIREESIMRLCSSLIRKSNDGHCFEFAHFSVQEFLQSESSLAPEFYQISEFRANRLLALQCLHFLQLENFGLLPRSPREALTHIGVIGDKWSLYNYAAVNWPIFARGEWNDQPIIHAALSLFHPDKTAVFTSWAVEFIHHFYRPYKVYKMTMERKEEGKDSEYEVRRISVVLDKKCRPLHFAATLSLPVVCSSLLQHTEDVNLECQIGTPIQCAVQGIFSIEIGIELEGAYTDGYLSPEPRSRLRQPIASSSETIGLLLEKGATVPRACSEPYLGKTLIQMALIVSRRYGIEPPGIQTLIEGGIELLETDLEAFSAEFNFWEGIGLVSEVEELMRRIIMSLNHMIDKSPHHLDLCSLAWRKAVAWGFDFAFDLPSLDTRISLSEDALREKMLSAVKSSNLEALEKLLRDSRLNAADVTDLEGNSLLHLALLNSREETSLDVVERLLASGCSPFTTNAKGAQPIHRWGWDEHTINDSNNENHFEALVRVFVSAGVTCASQDQDGQNALHLYVGYPAKLTAFLKYDTDENIAVALATTDNSGHTPFTWALDRVETKSALLLLKRSDRKAGIWHSPTPVLCLAAKQNSSRAFEILLALGVQIAPVQAKEPTPLHYLGNGVSLKFVNRLKSLYEGACESRFNDRLPVEIYLESVLSPPWNVADFNVEIVESLYPSGLMQSESGEGRRIWEALANTAGLHVEADWMSYDGRSSSCRACFTIAANALLRLGAMRSYEADAKQSGLVPLFDLFGKFSSLRNQWPFPTETICRVVEQTEYWPTIQKSDDIVDLLQTAVKSRTVDIVELLLKRGVDVHQRRNGISTLDYVCKHNLSDSTQDDIFAVLLEHADKPRLDELNEEDEYFGLLHYLARPDQIFQIRDLIAKGADPDIRTQKWPHRTAIVYHVLKRNFGAATALLKNGADPTKTCRSGYDAALAAVFRGATPFLAELHGTQNSKWQINWQAKCDVWIWQDDQHAEFSGANGLHLAAVSGSVDCLEFYLRHGLIEDLETTSGGLYTPVHFAAMEGHSEVIRFLWLRGANINAQAKDGSTAMHLAVRSRKLDVVRLLIELEYEDKKDSQNMVPLLYAYKLDDQRIIDCLHASVKSTRFQGDTLEAGESCHPESNTKGHAHAFQAAIQNDNLGFCKELHAQNCSLEIRIPTCGTCSPLAYAIGLEKPDIVNWLLSNGATATTGGCTYHRSLSTVHEVIEHPRLHVFLPTLLDSYLRQGGVFLGEWPGLVYEAVCSENIDCLKLILQHLRANKEHYSSLIGEDASAVVSLAVNEPGGKYIIQTALHLASMRGYHEAVVLLLESGANIDSIDNQIRTSLHIAAGSNHQGASKVVEILIKNGAATECRDCLGRTPLIYALQRGRPETTQLLLDANSDMGFLDHSNKTPLHYATEGFFMDAVQNFAKLISLGLNLHARAVQGVSPFHLALGRAPFTSFLLNLDIRLDDSDPYPWVIEDRSVEWLKAPFRLLRKRFSHGQLQIFMNLNPTGTWSPLCISASAGEIRAMENLVLMGAQLDREGSYLGSALMAACSAGQLEAAKYLVRQKAVLTYWGPNGFRSAFDAAKNSRKILRWLQTERFTDQRKLPCSTNRDPIRASEDTKPWSGITKAELIIHGYMEREASEPARDYWRRLMRAKAHWRGRVVPLGSGRYTRCPSYLIPTEIVRIHPDGYNSKNSAI